MPEKKLTFNGINGATGDYGLPPMTGDELAAFIRGEGKPENLNELRFRHDQDIIAQLGVKEGVDPKKLAEAGWGIIFAHDADPAIKEALSDLIALRTEQAGAHFRLYEGGQGYRRNKDTKSSFLARHGAGPGPADPDKVPYYLLIVGSPEAIPYKFQYELDVQYAVGRLHFDTLQEYANYAASVRAAEKQGLKVDRRAAFFGVANPGDETTDLTTTKLIEPLSTAFAAKAAGWQVDTIVRKDAVKTQLQALLGGANTPALLMTGSHGMEFPLNDPRQLRHQGALLCQDWPGKATWGKKAIPQDFYFAGDDLTSDANLFGLLAFFFACYGAGTPQLDDFAKQAFKDRVPIAPFPFTAKLPQKMLSHPRGGALAVIGHIERAWTFSFDWPGTNVAQTTVFESTLQRLLDGHPVGSALEYFNERYAELSTVLSNELEEIEFGKKVEPYGLADMWTSNNDARGYAIFGDPAVRLPVAQTDEQPVARTAIPVQPIAQPENHAPAVAAALGALPAENALLPATPKAMSVGTAAEGTVVRTYVSSDLANPRPEELKIITRRAADGATETVVAPDVATTMPGLLALHQAAVAQRHAPEGQPNA